MLKITPNNNNIEFQLEVENTTFNKISPRLIVEVGGKTSIIPLKVSSDGVVKGVIELNESWNEKEGKIKLEIINESNYFIPFEKEVYFSDIKEKPKTTIKEVKTLESKPTIKVNPTISFTKLEVAESKKELKNPIKDNKYKFSSLVECTLKEEIQKFFKEIN